MSELVDQLIVVAVGIGLSGLGVLTWQRWSWNHQRDREEVDWRAREAHMRKESQMRSMEELVVAINRDVEAFVVALHMAVSAMARFFPERDHLGAATDFAADDQQALAQRHVSVGRCNEEFNQADAVWAARSRELAGEVSLYFGRQNEELTRLCGEMIKLSEPACQNLNDYWDTAGTSMAVWDTMRGVRRKKDELLTALQDEIDRFVHERLRETGYQP